jgi:uncharacterized delta-60 repeat protein
MWVSAFLSGRSKPMKTRSPFFKKNQLAGLVLAVVAALVISMAAQAAAGGLDPTFGTGGIVTTYIGSSNSFANAVAIQSDGKIVVAGTPLLVRYNSDGSLDTTFGTNGFVTNSGIDRGMDLVIQPDGKIVVVGFSGGGLFTCFHVARFNSDGSPDATFGTKGIAIPLTFQDNGADEKAYGHSIALGPNGKILVAGDFYDGDTHINYILMSLNSDGSLDSWNYFPISTEDFLTTMAVQPDGKILLAGTTFPGDFIDYDGPRIGLVRAYYVTDPTDGSTSLQLDPSFGAGGIAVTDFGKVGFVDYSAAIQSDGKIVAVGEYGCTTTTNNPPYCTTNGFKFSLARFNSNGSLDTTFGANGLSITNLSDMSDVDFSDTNQGDKLLAIQPDGKLVVAEDTSNGHFFVARFNSNGSLDTTFGTAGEIATAFGNYNDDVQAVVLQPDGKIIAAGSSSNGTNTGIALARYIAGTITTVSTTFISQAANDGWILESTPTSNVGGTQNSSATTFNVGDDPNNKQYRSILSFNTASIPDTAVVTSAQLKIRIQGIVGTDPFATFGNLLVDIRNGHFGNSIGLELADFSSAASSSTYQDHISAITYNWYGVNLSAANLGLISKIGVTQFRLRFSLSSNNDKIADYDKFYSGNAPSGYQPQLIITYYVP